MATFEKGSFYSEAEFKNLYFQNIVHHLPKISQIQFKTSKGAGGLNFVDCLDFMNWWWKGTKSGINFDSSWPSHLSTSLSQVRFIILKLLIAVQEYLCRI